MSSSAFFSDSASVLERSVDIAGEVQIPQDIEDQYEVQRCVDFITKNAFTKVALQFPDELLGISGTLAGLLQSRTAATVCILGDTSYGSCCVDEVAAQHGGADAIIHFGPACLSPTRRTPVLYVFGRGDVDVGKCCEAFRSLLPDTKQYILVLSDVRYSHALGEIQKRLEGEYSHLVVCDVEVMENIPPKDTDGTKKDDSDISSTGLPCECNSGSCCSKGQAKNEAVRTKEELPEQTAPLDKDVETEEGERTKTGQETNTGGRGDSSELLLGRRLNLKEGTQIKDYAVFYVGCEGRTLTNCMMTLNRCAFWTFNPVTGEGRRETLNVNRALMKRHHMIERAKDANVVGIAVGTLGVANYLGMIAHLKKLLRHAGKKCYTFAVGKLNVPKLANFMEVDVYVLVACPENSLIDSKEFYRPVVTPFEMEIACNEAREWTGEYITDFNRLIPGASDHVEIPASSSSSRTDVSLITGQLRSAGVREDDGASSSGSGAVVKRDEALTVSTVHKNASEFLAARSWQGLEQNLGETEVSMATEGRKGIAASYTHEDS